jgi:FKBP-type peptidyl-prolyl cis-trans isomerase FklB
MKVLKIFVFVFIGLISISAQNKLTIKSIDDSVSYSIGQNIGNNLKDPFMKINFDILFKGMKDAVDGVQSEMTPEQMQQVMVKFNQKLNAKKQEEQKVIGEKKKVECQNFLEENKKKEGVVLLPSGLQYKVLVKGSGNSPKPEDKVKVHYTGTLIDGTKFDSSYDRNAPAEFGVTQVIKGWTEALQLMHVGDKWQLFIPSDLAYGENGAGGVIGPNEALIFEVELLDIIKQQ